MTLQEPLDVVLVHQGVHWWKGSAMLFRLAPGLCCVVLLSFSRPSLMKSAAVKVTRGTRKAPRNKKSNNEPFGNGPARFTNFSRNARNNGLISPGAPMTALRLLRQNRTNPGPRGLLTINPEVLPFNAPVTVLNNSPSSRNVRNGNSSTLRRRHQTVGQVLLVEAPDEEGREGQVLLVEAPDEEFGEQEEEQEEEEDAPNLLYECVGLALIVGGLYYGFQVFSGQKTTM